MIDSIETSKIPIQRVGSEVRRRSLARAIETLHRTYVHGDSPSVEMFMDLLMAGSLYFNDSLANYADLRDEIQSVIDDAF